MSDEGDSAGKDAGGAIVHRATREAAGCGRLPHHPAARRAAKNEPTDIRIALGQPAGRRRRLACPATLCKPQDAASRHKLNTATV